MEVNMKDVYIGAGILAVVAIFFIFAEPLLGIKSLKPIGFSFLAAVALMYISEVLPHK